MIFALMMASLTFFFISFVAILVPFVILCAMEKTKWVLVPKWGPETSQSVFWMAMNAGGWAAFATFLYYL